MKLVCPDCGMKWHDVSLSGRPKKYTPGTLESILEDRLADLLIHNTIDEDAFVSLVMDDAKQEKVHVLGEVQALFSFDPVREVAKGLRSYDEVDQAIADDLDKAIVKGMEILKGECEDGSRSTN